MDQMIEKTKRWKTISIKQRLGFEKREIKMNQEFGRKKTKVLHWAAILNCKAGDRNGSNDQEDEKKILH
jgi:hypothetical protein